ncbi:MAG: BamA/TamA family outer membrane protein [Pirellulales bacterium]|nr:BamA/TamA family outer membrane protein [Pirellulales bacterium]
MIDSIRTSMARLSDRFVTGCLVIASGTVLFSGCAQLGGSNLQSLTANSPTVPGASPAPPRSQFVGGHSGTIQQVAATGTTESPQHVESPQYVARQFPADTPPPSGSALPPGGTLAPGPSPFSSVGGIDPYAPLAPQTSFIGPRIREADLIIQGFPARTGRITLGGAVNSDAGLTGQLTIDERNFDIMRWPTSFRDLFSGNALRGAGQTLRLEAAPGTDFKRYTIQFADPNLLGFMPVSMSVSGFLFDRRFNDWDEERLGGRLAFGYRVTPDLSVSVGVSGQNVEITNPSVLNVQPLQDVLNQNNELYSGEISLIHDTRNSPIQASQGHYFEFSFEEVFGRFDYARFEMEYRKYWLLAKRPDDSGKQTLTYTTQLGFSGDDTPIFENFFAGGFATLRGFDFRGASPVISGVEVGGRFQWLNSLEYMFPITADDAFAGVAFVDFGTVESDIEINDENFRVAPGLGLRVAIPMLGPAPLAFDFAYPVAMADTDDRRIFSFYVSAVR